MKKLLFFAAAMFCAFAFTACDKEEIEDNAKKQDPPTPTDSVPAPEAFVKVQANWSVALVGDPFEEDDYYYQAINVTAPGIKYFWVEAWTDEEIAEYYGTLDSLLLDYEQETMEFAEDGELGDYLYTLDDEAVYMTYYGVGPFDVYIFEFDEDGKATGRIGLNKDVTFPEYSEKAPLRSAARNNTYYAPTKKIFKIK